MNRIELVLLVLSALCACAFLCILLSIAVDATKERKLREKREQERKAISEKPELLVMVSGSCYEKEVWQEEQDRRRRACHTEMADICPPPPPRGFARCDNEDDC